MRKSNQLLFVFSLFTLIACTAMPIKTNSEISANHQFQEVWEQITSDPVDKLPQDKISYRKLFSGGKNIILGDSQRTLNEHSDILPSFNKLAHPNGICLKGTWDIHTDNKYSGYFKKGSKALIIVRASTAMSNTRLGEVRSFGLAGKIFPTLNPLERNQEQSANFFLIDDLGGTKAKHYTDVTLTNEPAISINSVVLKSFLYVQKIARTFSKVDKNPKIRQVYEISHLGEGIGEGNNATILTPKWMKVVAKSGQTIDAIDFRDELLINGNQLVFIVSVASTMVNNQKEWQTIGSIILDESVVSKSCDHKLHFHHPIWRSDLNH